MPSPIAWKNGSLVSFEELSLPVWDLGVVAGASVTEMARTFGGQPFRLNQHIDRLLSSCESLEVRCRFSAADLFSAALQITETNSRLISQDTDLGIVMFVTAGANLTYLGPETDYEPTVVVHTFPLPFELWRIAATDGVQLVIPSRRQISSSALPVQAKTRNRFHWWLADREAAKIRAGARALLMNEDGFLTETSTSAFFAVQGDTILTPRTDVLDSMSRRIVREAAEHLGFQFREVDMTPELLSDCSECFLTSTPSGLFSVATIDDRTWPVYREGSAANQVLEYWKSLTTINPRDQILQASEVS